MGKSTVKLVSLQETLRRLSKWSIEYQPNEQARKINGYELKGYSGARLSLAVYKETIPADFAIQQGSYMEYLTSSVCPRILSYTDNGYVMEYLESIRSGSESIRLIEQVLHHHVWSRPNIIFADNWKQELSKTLGFDIPKWALEKPCLIHGDPTIDNTLRTPTGFIRITDPIPPINLMRPSIRSVDCGKMLQSILGWETALRGASFTEYDWPLFMKREDTAQRAVFWCMVALKRISLRNTDKNKPGIWAEVVSKELEKCVSSF